MTDSSVGKKGFQEGRPSACAALAAGVAAGASRRGRSQLAASPAPAAAGRWATVCGARLARQGACRLRQCAVHAGARGRACISTDRLAAQATWQPGGAAPPLTSATVPMGSLVFRSSAVQPTRREGSVPLPDSCPGCNAAAAVTAAARRAGRPPPAATWPPALDRLLGRARAGRLVAHFAGNPLLPGGADWQPGLTTIAGRGVAGDWRARARPFQAEELGYPEAPIAARTAGSAAGASSCMWLA